MYGLLILSHVIYLRPNAGRNDLGGYIQNITEYRFIVEYKVIRLIEIDGQSVFETQNVGFIPFAPLMNPPTGIDKYQWAVQCNEKTKSLSFSSNVRSNLLVSQWFMSGLVNPHHAIADFVQEEIVQESSVYHHLLETTGKDRYQEGLQRGTELGSRKIALESLSNVLEHRFDSFAVRLLLPTLTDISDVNVLKKLLNIALEVQELEEFINNWEPLENGQ